MKTSSYPTSQTTVLYKYLVCYSPGHIQIICETSWWQKNLVVQIKKQNLQFLQRHPINGLQTSLYISLVSWVKGKIYCIYRCRSFNSSDWMYKYHMSLFYYSERITSGGLKGTAFSKVKHFTGACNTSFSLFSLCLAVNPCCLTPWSDIH